MTVPKSNTLAVVSITAILFVLLAGFVLPGGSTSKPVDDQQSAEQGKLVFEKYGCFVTAMKDQVV
jgi:hypothetical protein